ncbi:MAG: DUF3575 domain-containing protein [Hymenobacter sp.]|nr:MAG: DUF3575 domain-containing protein [Hymenobacter sp.]
MKYFLLLASLASSLLGARAQDQPASKPIVSVGIYGPSANVGLQVEQRLGRHFSLGAFGIRQLSSDFRGYQGALVGRYYFRPTAPTGLYVQALVGFFNTRATVVSYYPGATSAARSELTAQGSGGGLGLGYQWRFAQHFTATLGLGIKAYPTSLGTCDCAYERDWHAIGQPGSVLDGQLSIGYAL